MSLDFWYVSTHHSVGQGLMHSGQVVGEGGNVLLSYMYDCGSTTGSSSEREVRLEVEIKNAKRGKRSLDVLYISHFDEDHVNGVDALFRLHPPSTIVIPATTLDERVLRLAHRVAMGEEVSTSSASVEIVLNPAAALRALAASHGREVDIIAVPSDPEESQARLDGPARSTGDGVSVDSDSGVSICSDGGTDVWLLRPWVQRCVQEQAVAFREALGCSTEADLLTLVRRELASAGFRKLIRDAYESSLKKVRKSDVINFTSLCLYSGPASGIKGTYRSRRVPAAGTGVDGFTVLADRLDVGAWGISPGWIGTGDALLKEKNRVAEFTAAFSDVLQEVGQMTLPHHGSAKNFSIGLIGGARKNITFIGSSGSGNSYGHPSRKVLHAVASVGAHSVIVNESVLSRFTQVCHVQLP